MRSTGLGKKELIGDLTGLEARNDHVILHINTTSPVHWHIRIALTRQDIVTVVRVFVRYLVNGSLAKVLLGWSRKLAPLEPY